MKSCPRRGTHTHTHTQMAYVTSWRLVQCAESEHHCLHSPLNSIFRSTAMLLNLHSDLLNLHISLRHTFSIHHKAPLLRLNGENSSHTATTIEGDNGCLATVEMWAGMLFDSEPATSPLPCNKTPEICLSKAGTIGAGRAWEEMLISSQDSLHVCYPICVFIICVLRSGRDVTSDI